MTQILSQCEQCRHFFPHIRDRNACAAFPQPDAPIPQDVFFNRVDHRQPVPGDHGTQFAARPGAWHPLGEGGVRLPAEQL